jgi:hypothetical protein
MTRRDLLLSAATAAGATLAAGGTAAPLGSRPNPGWIDVNVSLGRWPLRRLPYDDPERLTTKLLSRSVTQAWAGTLDGLLHKDLQAANARLAEDCRRYGRGLLLPFGSINPKQPGWEEDLEQCVRVHQMRGVRLHPNYHGYRLDDPAFASLIHLAAGHKLVVQIALVMEDERITHPLFRVEPVDPALLVDVARRTPGLRLVLINAMRTLRGEAMRRIISAGNVSVEIAMLEGVGALGNLLEDVPVDRIMFGSHAPLFYFEAAELKLRESRLTQEQHRAVCRENAERLLK